MSKKTILVVDDTEWNRDLVVQLLEDDYTVLQAVDGEEAVRKTQEDKPDLILMDLGMPVMDGWQVIDELKATGRLSSTQVVVITSASHRAPAGIPVFQKPLDLEKVIKHVHLVC